MNCNHYNDNSYKNDNDHASSFVTHSAKNKLCVHKIFIKNHDHHPA